MTRVVAGVLVRGRRVLIARRLPGAHQGGLWEFPGGKVEAGESDEAALRRELREEIAIDAEVGPLVLRLAHTYPGRDPIDLAFFACRLRAGEPRPIGCDALAWVGLEEIPRYRFPAANEAVVARLRSLDGPADLFAASEVPFVHTPRRAGGA